MEQNFLYVEVFYKDNYFYEKSTFILHLYRNISGLVLSRSAQESLGSRLNFPLPETYSMLSSLDWAPWRGEMDGRGSPRFRIMCLFFVRTLLSTTPSWVHLLSLSLSLSLRGRPATRVLYIRSVSQLKTKQALGSVSEVKFFVLLFVLSKLLFPLYFPTLA